jgi:hypothetical protein
MEENFRYELIESYFNQLSTVEPGALLLFLLLSLAALWVLNTVLKAPLWIVIVGIIAWLYFF